MWASLKIVVVHWPYLERLRLGASIYEATADYGCDLGGLRGGESVDGGVWRRLEGGLVWVRGNLVVVVLYHY